MNSITFNQDQQLICSISDEIENPTDQIKNEPMLFSASPEFALKEGGPLTHLVLAHLVNNNLLTEPEEGFFWVIDTRVHMLMRGQFPAIPGWHGDAVPRPGGPENQPDFSLCDPRVQHYVVLFSDHPEGVSNTSFLKENVTVNLTQESPVWNQVDTQVRSRKDLQKEYLPDRQIWKFSQLALHAAEPACRNGWRFFFRMSKLMRPAKNEIRHQVQVYTTEGLGW